MRCLQCGNFPGRYNGPKPFNENQFCSTECELRYRVGRLEGSVACRPLTATDVMLAQQSFTSESSYRRAYEETAKRASYLADANHSLEMKLKLVETTKPKSEVELERKHAKLVLSHSFLEGELSALKAKLREML